MISLCLPQVGRFRFWEGQDGLIWRMKNQFGNTCPRALWASQGEASIGQHPRGYRVRPSHNCINKLHFLLVVGYGLTGVSVLTTIGSLWECQSPRLKIPWEAVFAVTKVLSHCWQANCKPQLGNLPAGEPMSDTCSTNAGVVYWRLWIPHCAEHTGKGKGSFWPGAGMESCKQTSHRLQLQVQMHSCSHQRFQSCKDQIHSKPEVHIQRRGPGGESVLGRAVGTQAVLELACHGLRKLTAEFSRFFQTSWYRIGSLESTMVGVFTPRRLESLTNQILVYCRCCCHCYFPESRLLNTSQLNCIHLSLCLQLFIVPTFTPKSAILDHKLYDPPNFRIQRSLAPRTGNRPASGGAKSWEQQMWQRRRGRGLQFSSETSGYSIFAHLCTCRNVLLRKAASWAILTQFQITSWVPQFGEPPYSRPIYGVAIVLASLLESLERENQIQPTHPFGPSHTTHTSLVRQILLHLSWGSISPQPAMAGRCPMSQEETLLGTCGHKNISITLSVTDSSATYNCLLFPAETMLFQDSMPFFLPGDSPLPPPPPALLRNSSSAPPPGSFP